MSMYVCPVKRDNTERTIYGQNTQNLVGAGEKQGVMYPSLTFFFLSIERMKFDVELKPTIGATQFSSSSGVLTVGTEGPCFRPRLGLVAV